MPQGFIWIGSDEGLTRYDGYSCIVYRHETNNLYSVADNEILALCTDSEGALWVGTRNGLSRYDPQFDRFENFYHDGNDVHSPAGNEIFALAKSPDGNIWVGTYGGGLDMIEKNPKGNEKKKFQFIHYKNDENKNSISSNQIFSICFDNAGLAWIGTANGLNAFNVSAKTFTHLFHVQDNANSITSNMVRKVYKDDNGKIWICGSGMLDNISQKKNDQSNFFIQHFLPIVATNKNFSHVVVNDLIKDRNDNYWIGTNDNGLIKFRIADKQLSSVEQYTSDERSSYSLTNSTVFNLYEDHSGIIWIGTAKGVSKYLPSKKRFAEVAMNYPLTRNEHSVNTLLTDKFGRLWLGGDSDTLNISNKPSSPFSTKQFPVLPGNDNQVNILYQSKRSDIYIGTFRQGVFVIPNSVDNRLDKKTTVSFI